MYYDTNGKLLAVGAEQPPETDGEDFEEDDSDDWDAVEPYKVEWYVACVLKTETSDLLENNRFKLLLRSSTSAATNTDIPRTVLPPQKNVEAVYADFYKYMFEHTQRYIRETHSTGALLWDSLEGDIEFILTHPNGWEGQQQSIMRRAAVEAGLVPNTSGGHDRIKFVSEGEASFHFCVSSGMLEDAIEVSDHVRV